MIETLPRVIVREAESFPDLAFPTTAPAIEQLPAVIVEQAEAVLEMPVLLGPLDDLFVPPEAEQRLIYQWLRDGPLEWRASIVAQATPEEARVVVPLFRPDLPRGPRRRHDAGDGLARVIRYRE